MKGAALFLMAIWAAWAVGELGHADDVRQEKAHCLAGLELEFEMPEWCDKYKKLGEMK